MMGTIVLHPQEMVQHGLMMYGGEVVVFYDLMYGEEHRSWERSAIFNLLKR